MHSLPRSAKEVHALHQSIARSESLWPDLGKQRFGAARW
jgi:hypothetical protein